MNRRNFLKILSCLPWLNKVPIKSDRILYGIDWGFEDPFVAETYFYHTFNLHVDNPRACGVITGITE
jgi:hypothetical protein